MGKRRIIWLSALGASLLGLGLIAALLPKEPSYAGRPLTFWIDQLPARLVMTNGYSESYPGAYATRAEAQADQERLLRAAAEARGAVKSLGSQCLPFLLRRLNTREHSFFHAEIVPWCLRLHVLKPSSRASRSPALIRGQALEALLILDREASPAVPDLVMLANSTDQEIRLAARHALEGLAPDELERVQHE